MRRFRLATALALALGLALAGQALGQRPAAGPPAPEASEGEGGEASVEAMEREALELMHADKLVTARSRAEQIVKRAPSSFIGHLVLGVALRDGEASLPRAMRELETARSLYEKAHGPGVVEGAPWPVHAEILRALQYTALLLEDFPAQLRALDDYDENYGPPMVAQRVWPLMKLGRFDEARATAKVALADPKSPYRGSALNGLCVVESEAHEREAAHDACLAVLEYGRLRRAAALDPSKAPGIAVYANNAALSALGVLRHDEAERLLLEGVQKVESTTSNPWRHLTELYVLEGRMAEALSAVKAMQSWRARQPPELREQGRADIDATVALLLLAAGDADKGLFFADRALDRPDRRAMISTRPDQTLGAHALLRRALEKLRAEVARERASYAPLKERAKEALSRVGLGVGSAADQERVARAIADERTLDATVRTYLDGGLEYVPSWLQGDLVEVGGPAVIAASLARARAAEADRPAFAPFFDALEAEIALSRGKHAKALSLARSALDRLPRAEALLAARVAAVGAQAASLAGDRPGALSLFERAYAADAGTLRRLGLALPARVVPSGSNAAFKAGELLARSPRLEKQSGAFVVNVFATGSQGLRACLLSPQGNTLGCASAERPAGGDEALARELCAQFHDRLFGLRQGTDGLDLRSLDGSTSVNDLEREQLKKLIDEATGL